MHTDVWMIDSHSHFTHQTHFVDTLNSNLLKVVQLWREGVWKMSDGLEEDCGLPNFGRTCYVNAAVQAIQPLLAAFLSPESATGVCCDSSNKHSMLSFTITHCTDVSDGAPRGEPRDAHVPATLFEQQGRDVRAAAVCCVRRTRGQHQPRR